MSVIALQCFFLYLALFYLFGNIIGCINGCSSIALMCTIYGMHFADNFCWKRPMKFVLQTALSACRGRHYFALNVSYASAGLGFVRNESICFAVISSTSASPWPIPLLFSPILSRNVRIWRPNNIAEHWQCTFRDNREWNYSICGLH